MLLRKRAWDILRENFAAVREDATLADVVRALEEIRKTQPDTTFVLVFSHTDQFIGLISLWNLIEGIGPCLLQKAAGEGPNIDWDKAFALACRNCVQIRALDCVQREVPKIKPNDPLARVLEVFLDYRRSRAVVEEGGRIIGVVTSADVLKEISKSINL